MLYSPAATQYAAENVNTGAKSAGELVLMLIALVAILIATYFVTKYVAKLMQRGTLPIPGKKGGAMPLMRSKSARTGGYLELLDTVMLDRERAVTAVRSGDKVYILGYTQSSCTLIDMLPYTEPETAQAEEEDKQKPDFINMFKQYSGWGKSKEDTVEGSVDNKK